MTSRCSYDERMAVTVSAMFIPVHNPDAALAFYRDALGLEVRADVASEGLRWVSTLRRARLRVP
jgi:catechol 2,3-dioxygenase-like lactoylglutathione lyase family enzyme